MYLYNASSSKLIALLVRIGDTRTCYTLFQVSADSGAPVLEDRTIYRRYFQMIPSESSLPIVYKALLTMYGWHKLHTIASDKDVFSKVCS